ncbi:MAG: hypothetical protein WC846_02935 [Candidatus Gracilibacteria bacterium]|jgi:hypothetical protein
MKIKKYQIVVLAAVFAISLLGSTICVRSQDTAPNSAMLFVSLGKKPLPNEVSSYEVERAVEHFSDVLLGWTVEPAFHEEFKEKVGDYSFTGQRQEKQNLLFTVEGNFESAEPAKVFLRLLTERLEKYNTETSESYVVGLHAESFLTNEEGSNMRFIAGTILLSLIGAGFLLFLMEYAPNCS